MNVWILSVRELARLLRGRLTWLAAALTVLSPLAGLTKLNSLDISGVAAGIDTSPVANVQNLNITE